MLIKRTARVYFVLRKWQNRLSCTKSDTPLIQPGQIDRSKAENYWIKISQHDSFATEIKCLQEKNNLPLNSKIIGFSPFFDDVGIMRVGGRLAFSDLTQERKNPVFPSFLLFFLTFPFFSFTLVFLFTFFLLCPFSSILLQFYFFFSWSFSFFSLFSFPHSLFLPMCFSLFCLLILFFLLPFLFIYVIYSFSCFLFPFSHFFPILFPFLFFPPFSFHFFFSL